MPRPSKLTPEMIEAIAELRRAGCTLSEIAHALRIGETTLQKWIARGEAGQKPYVSLVAAIKAAQAQFIRSLVDSIRRAGEKQWQANAWLLERMFPDRFASPEARLKLLEKAEVEQIEISEQ